MFKRIHASECTEGDILAEDILNHHGAVLLPSGTIINEYIAQKIISVGVEYLLVSRRQRDAEFLDASYRHFEKRFEDSVQELKHLSCDLAKGKRLDYATLCKITGTILSGWQEPEHVLKYLSKIRDANDVTYYHSINVSFYAALIAGWLNLARDDIKIIIHAALLHDLGKLRIPNELLNKEEKLSLHEFAEIKRHTVYGYELIREDSSIADEVKDAILMHHEREDKSGYPLGVGCDDLCICTKIVAVADVYDAMTSERPYKKALTPFEAFEEFLTVGLGNMDVRIVNTLLFNLSRYYVGSRVLLNNGLAGNIAYIPPHRVWKPIVDTGSTLLDLSREEEISIASMA